jgi:hypothetical protein
MRQPSSIPLVLTLRLAMNDDARIADCMSPSDQADLRRLLLHRLTVLGAALKRVAELANTAAHAPEPSVILCEVESRRSPQESRLLQECVAETLNWALLGLEASQP